MGVTKLKTRARGIPANMLPSFRLFSLPCAAFVTNQVPQNSTLSDFMKNFVKDIVEDREKNRLDQQDKAKPMARARPAGMRKGTGARKGARGGYGRT